MKKPLELIVYPWVDRWVDYTMDFMGKSISGSSREMGYETPHGVWRGDEFPEKRLTDSELAAEYWRATPAQYREYVQTDGSSVFVAERDIINQFCTLPHFDE